MNNKMNKEPTEEELDLAVEEFMKTYKSFEKAARRLMAIMEDMNKKRQLEIEALSRESQETYEFLIQTKDQSGHIGEKSFGIRCVADKEKKEEL